MVSWSACVAACADQLSGKSTLAAGIALACMFCDGEGGSENYVAASDKEQAGLIYQMASGMIEQNPDLDHRAKVLRSTKRIMMGTSFFRAISANDGAAHGFNSHCVIGDELHAWKGREMLDVLTTSVGSRQNPLLCWISTAGSDRESVCYEMYDRACKVRDGHERNPEFLPVIYEAPQDADWTDPETWRAANPCMGVSIREDYLAGECTKAKSNTALQNTFRRLHLNQWTSQVTRWISMNDWMACPTEEAEFDPLQPIYGGFDLSVTTDFTAWCVWQPSTGIARWRYWLPRDRAEQLEQIDLVPYSAWYQDGLLSLTPGSTIDFQFVRSEVLLDCEKFDVQAIGLDPAFAIESAQHLEREGFPCVKIAQNYAGTNAACDELFRRVIAREINHGNNRITNWMVDNVEIEHNAGMIKVRKPKRQATRRKIDGVTAIVNAIAVSLTRDDSIESVYDTPGAMRL